MHQYANNTIMYQNQSIQVVVEAWLFLRHDGTGQLDEFILQQSGDCVHLVENQSKLVNANCGDWSRTTSSPKTQEFWGLSCTAIEIDDGGLQTAAPMDLALFSALNVLMKFSVNASTGKTFNSSTMIFTFAPPLGNNGQTTFVPMVATNHLGPIPPSAWTLPDVCKNAVVKTERPLPTSRLGLPSMLGMPLFTMFN